MFKSEPISESELSRVLQVTVKDKELVTPTYFPAASSVEFGNRVSDLIFLVGKASYPRLLVSAYDLDKFNRVEKTRLEGELSNYVRSGNLLMIDSGVFESYWRSDKTWRFASYQKIIRKFDSDFYFSYDLLPAGSTENDKGYVDKTINKIGISSKVKSDAVCIPILHATGPKKLLSFVRNFARSNPKLCNVLSIPERECGDSLVERARTVSQLREILNNLGLKNSLIHLLGCGNPISMATYAYFGADTFDSVDWSRVLFEPIELRIYDLAQVELLKCKCKICKTMVDKPWPRALLHNLLFYQDFVLQLQRMIRDNTFRDFLLQFLGKTILEHIERKGN